MLVETRIIIHIKTTSPSGAACKFEEHAAPLGLALLKNISRSLLLTYRPSGALQCPPARLPLASECRKEKTYKVFESLLSLQIAAKDLIGLYREEKFSP